MNLHYALQHLEVHGGNIGDALTAGVERRQLEERAHGAIGCIPVEMAGFFS